jgi:Tol biopolymer transport system component
MGVSSDGSTIYYTPSVARPHEIFRARPENGPGHLLARYAQSRISFTPTGYALSPDDRWLAVPLKDAGTTNIWVISTADGSFRQITDFKRPTLIARQVSWSPVGKFIHAAVVNRPGHHVIRRNVAVNPRSSVVRRLLWNVTLTSGSICGEKALE